MLTASATEPVRPLCSSGRHPRHASLLSKRAAGTSQPNAYVGEKRQLLLLANFSDQPFKDEDPLTLWSRIFNEENLTEPPFYGSVRDYFLAQSYGNFDLCFDLYLITPPQEHAAYRSGYTQGSPDDTGSGLLLTEMLDAVKDSIPDWSVYDWDDDGNIEQVVILYAGKGQNESGDTCTIWPHQWRLSEQSEPPFIREWGHPYIVVSGEKEYRIDNYGAFPELNKEGNYGTFGTFCHEYGHCLRLPDFYYGASTKVVGAWDIMDSGNYNMDGFCPPGFSAHERMLLGWLDVTELTEPISITDMPALAEQGEAYLIRNDGAPNEYYIIENRQPIGWDVSLPSSGVLIFHIDYDEDVWRYGLPNSSSLKRYTLFPANNQAFANATYWKDWAYPYNGNDALTNESKPAAKLNNENTDGTKLMSKPVTGIAIHDGLASFDFMGGTTGIENVNGNGNVNDNGNVNGSLAQAVYDMSGRLVFNGNGNDNGNVNGNVNGNGNRSGVYMVRDKDGKVKKVILH